MSDILRRSQIGAIRSASRACFVWEGYSQALHGYGADLKLRLLVLHGVTLVYLYGPTQTLLARPMLE